VSASHQAPDTLPNALAWAKRAACRGQDLELFFSEALDKITAAKRICGRCPVRALCLDEVLGAENTSRYGVYGGLSAPERAKLVGQRLPPYRA
jgi:WhiB family redox-sensing transcriptional regulator